MIVETVGNNLAHSIIDVVKEWTYVRLLETLVSILDEFDNSIQYHEFKTVPVTKWRNKIATLRLLPNRDWNKMNHVSIAILIHQKYVEQQLSSLNLIKTAKLD